jgi:hypothetical protein
VADQGAFDAAVDEVTRVTERLLGSLKARGPARTREGEIEKARQRWKLREARIARPR